jgi:hypothetical protein
MLFLSLGSRRGTDSAAIRRAHNAPAAGRWAAGPGAIQSRSGAPCSFRDECRLADACVTADEQHRRRALAGGRDRALESGQFVITADAICG